MLPEDIARARQHWDEGRPEDAGRILSAALMPGQRPLWAADILDCCTSYLKPRPMEIPNLIILARDPERWQWARVAFDDLRRMSLVMDRMPVREVFAHIFNLAEDVAKITYNASNPSTPFDDKCQWRIVVTAWNIAQAMRERDADFDARVWSALTGGNQSE